MHINEKWRYNGADKQSEKVCLDVTSSCLRLLEKIILLEIILTKSGFVV